MPTEYSGIVHIGIYIYMSVAYMIFILGILSTPKHESIKAEKQSFRENI